MRPFLLLLTACLLQLSAFPLHAQVAAPGFEPGLPSLVPMELLGLSTVTFTPDNPAALLWSGASQAGGGSLRATDAASSSGPKRRFKGEFAGLRLVGNNMAIAWEDLTATENAPAPLHQERVSSFQFSARISDDISWGIGRDKSFSDDGTLMRSNDGLVLGASARLFGLVFLGIALGNEAVKEESPGLPPKNFDRELRQFGAALRHMGDYNIYAAVERIEKDDFPSSPDRDERLALNRVVLQTMAWDILLGISVSSILHQDRAKFTLTHVDLGYRPWEWLSLAIRVSSFKPDQATQPPTDQRDTLSIVAVYQF